MPVFGGMTSFFLLVWLSTSSEKLPQLVGKTSERLTVGEIGCPLVDVVWGLLVEAAA